MDDDRRRNADERVRVEEGEKKGTLVEEGERAAHRATSQNIYGGQLITTQSAGGSPLMEVVADQMWQPASSMELTISLDTEASSGPESRSESRSGSRADTRSETRFESRSLNSLNEEITEITVGAKFDDWAKEKKVPELSAMQREGVMYILQSAQNRLMYSIDQLQEDVTEVVSRFLPPDCDRLASVTSSELTKHLYGFKDQVRQCMSFESISFFKGIKGKNSIARGAKKPGEEFGQVAWLRCNGDHKVHVFMNDEESIKKSAGSGLKCMFCET